MNINIDEKAEIETQCSGTGAEKNNIFNQNVSNFVSFRLNNCLTTYLFDFDIENTTAEELQENRVFLSYKLDVW